jgi:hypothetical protein
MLGSYYAFISSTCITICLFVRTEFEDYTLQDELIGYVAYSRKTKFKLIPKIW